MDDEHLVHEAVGPAFTPVEAGAAIAIGVLSLLLAGVQGLLLGAMVDQHRLATQDIGLSAMLEALAVGAATALTGVLIQPRRLRIITIVAAIALTGCDFATSQSSGATILAIRAIAGIPEGVLFWITIAMIARTLTPERWAGTFITGIVIAQFAGAWVTATFIMPAFGPTGGFIFMASTCLLAIPIAFFLPDRYGPLPQGDSASFPLPLRGWVSLVAILMLTAAAGAVFIYMVPIAHQAGLPITVAGTANYLSLAAQIAAGVLAVALAGRAKYFPVLVLGGLATVGAIALYALHQPAWLFIAVTVVFGFTSVFVNPFFVPMTIDADPSRRTAVQNGAAQMFGGALGPFLASRVVSDADVHGSLVLGGALTVVGTALVAWLRLTHRPAPAP